MPCYLGLDLGTHTGFAFLTTERDRGMTMVSGAWDCSFKRGHDSPSLRFAKFGESLGRWLELSPDYCFYELVRFHRGVQAGHIYGGFLAQMQAQCDEYGVPFVGLSVQEIKKHMTGKGNASKDQMVEAAKSRGYDPQSEDEADAIGIVLRGRETRSC